MNLYKNTIKNFGIFLVSLLDKVFKKPDFSAMPKAIAAINKAPKGTNDIKLSYADVINQIRVGNIFVIS